MNDYNRRYERAITAVIAEGAERGDFVLAGLARTCSRRRSSAWPTGSSTGTAPTARSTAAEIADVFASTFLYGVVRRDGVAQ